MPSIDDVFARARRLAGEERARYLDAACADEPVLRAEVESLLAEFDRLEVDTGGVARKVHEAAAATIVATAEPLPDRIGPFRIVGLLGQGGMGTVYEAEQVELVRRRVALKVIRPGSGSREVLARFEAERQALAVMDHPHVARFLDVGATDDGRPWFAMELVPGVALNRYCDEHRLPTRRRLELFLDACHAVQHAHQKGVVHRDLKPSNILVAEREDGPDVKVIDFGIAKALGAEPGMAELQTQDGHVLGTPAYMSPEQAAGARQDVDTRTDVYSLGIVLYELLTGRLPFDAETTSAREWLEKLAGGKTTPPVPSSRVATLQGEKAREVTHAHAATLSELSRELRGDLDWIVLAAMEPDRERRYESVSALAADVRRHLADEPVAARPPSAWYRLRKFARRHRTGVALGAIFAVSLVGLTAALGVQSIRLARQRDVARTAQADAEREAEGARRVSDFLVELFEASDPTDEGAIDVTARQIVERGTERLQGELKDQPLLRARMLDALGRVNGALGLHPQAEALLREALETRQAQLPPSHPDVVASLDVLGSLLVEVGRAQEARSLLEQALAVKRATLGDAHRSTADTLSNLGWALTRLHEHEEARAALEAAVATHRKLDAPTLPESLDALAELLQAMDQPEQARPLLEESVAVCRKALGDEHPSVATHLDSLGLLLHRLGDDEASRAVQEEALRIRRKVLGPDHVKVAQSLNDLALTLDDLGEMQQLVEEALAIWRKALGPDHPDHAELASTAHNLGVLNAQLGSVETARELMEEALAMRRRLLGSEHDKVAGSLRDLAQLHRQQKDPAAARPLFEEAVAIWRKTLGPEHPTTTLALHELGSVMREMGDDEAARATWEECLAARRRSLTPPHADLAGILDSLGVLLFNEGDLDAARALLQESLDTKLALHGPDDAGVAHMQWYVGCLERAAGNLGAAEALMRQALATRGRALGAAHPMTKVSRRDLADVLRRQGRAAEAEALEREAPPSAP